MIYPAHGDDFARLSWHDNVVYGLRLEIGDPERDDWRSNLVLDLDHIVEWVGDEANARFRVAPATLSFQHATDLRIAVDCGDSGGQVALHALSIDAVTRERIVDQKICFDRPYYRWAIAFNWPRGGEIRFGASDFTLGFARRAGAAGPAAAVAARPRLTHTPRSRALDRSAVEAWSTKSGSRSRIRHRRRNSRVSASST